MEVGRAELGALTAACPRKSSNHAHPLCSLRTGTGRKLEIVTVTIR